MFDSTIGLAADIEGKVVSSAHLSMSNATTIMSGFLHCTAQPDETLHRYLDSVAFDLQESADAKRDGYAQQRLLSRTYFRRKRRLRKASRKSGESQADDHQEDTPKMPKKKRKTHHQQG